MSESKNIKINIYGQDYLLKSTADESYINKIADFVELKMKEIEETGLDANSQQLKIAVLSAMNIADDLFQSREKNSNIISTIENKGNSFIEYIEERIKDIESNDKG